MDCYYKLRQLFYYKVRHGLLQIATGITKCDEFITNCDRYYKVRWIYYKLRQVLQSAMDYYKLRQYNDYYDEFSGMSHH